jgi:hypothetical protein
MKLSNKRYKELDKLNGTQIGLEEEKISSIKRFKEIYFTIIVIF